MLITSSKLESAAVARVRVFPPDVVKSSPWYKLTPFKNTIRLFESNAKLLPASSLPVKTV